MSEVWLVRESSTTWLPGFQLGYLPNGLETQVRAVTRNGQIGLEVGGIVGSIPLTNGDTLHITPKVGEANFFKMLLVAEGLYDELKSEFEQSVSYEVDHSEALPRLVARALLSEMKVIQSFSLRFQRRKVVSTGEFASGRIRPLETVMRMRMRSQTPVVYEESLRDFDTAENRVLAEAASIALGYVKGKGAERDLVSIAQKWMYRFADRRRILEDILEVNSGLSRGFYSGARGYYVKALTLAKLILGHAGLSQGAISQVLGDAVVVNMADLFEEYVRAVLVQRYRQDGVVIRKGASPPEFLYVDGTCNLNPDITIARGTKYSAVGDAKYKVPDPGDHYQMAAYMSVFNVPHGFLLCPVYKKTEAGIFKRVSHSRRTVFEVRLPLDDLVKTDEMLTQLHEQIPFL